MAFDTFFLSGRDDLQLLNTDVSKGVLHHQPTQLFQHHAKGHSLNRLGIHLCCSF